MPNEMIINKFIPEIENYTNAVKHPSNNDHDHNRRWDGIKKLSAAEQHYPTHSYIDGCRNKIESAGKKDLKKDAYERKAPQYNQHGNTGCIHHIV